MKTDIGIQSRINHIDSINSKIFDLIYYSHFTFSDCESMTNLELKWFHKRLRELKDAEHEANQRLIDEANKLKK